jgi:hypothetical protein
VNREVDDMSPTFHRINPVWEANVDGKYGSGGVEIKANVKPSGANPLGCVKVSRCIRLRSLPIQLIRGLANVMYSLSHPKCAEKGHSPEGEMVFYPDCTLKVVNFQAANAPGTGTVSSVDRSKTTPGLGICDGFEAEVNVFVLANVQDVMV